MESDKIRKLKELSELYKSGILTKEELEEEKKKILTKDTIQDSPTENTKNKIAETKESQKEIFQTHETNSLETHTSSNLRKTSYNKKKLIYFGCSLIILIGIGVFIGLYQHHQTALEQKREKERLDSIAEVERLLEIQRQDSIRKDIYIRDFTSPDLCLFNLHGRIKSIRTKEGLSSLPYPLVNEILDFSLDGECINLKEIAARRISTSANDIRIKRNEDGYIVKIYEKGFENSSENGLKFEWINNNLTNFKGGSTWWGLEGKLSYSNNIVTSCYKGYWNGSDEDYDYYYTYKNFKFDIYGNWVECDYDCKIEIMEYRSDIDDSITTAHLKEEGKLKREITYHSAEN